MALVLSESFTAGIPTGFASVVLGSGAGALTATYNGGEQAVDLAKGALNGAWVLDAAGAHPDLRVVLDVEQVSADNGGSTASGIGLSFKASSEGFHHFVGLFTESATVAVYAGSTGDPIGSTVADGPSLPLWVSIAGRVALEFAVVRGVRGSRQIQLRVDGELVYLGAVRSVADGDSLLPGVFLRDATYRLHAVDVYDDATVFAPPLRSDLRGAARMSPGALAPQNRLRAVPVLHADAVDGGPFRVAGTVKIDGTPPVPVRRRVRLFDVISGRLVRQVWSDTGGAFSFERVRAGEYLVVSDDYTRAYNAVVADRVLAVL